MRLSVPWLREHLARQDKKDKSRAPITAVSSYSQNTKSHSLMEVQYQEAHGKAC